MSSPRSHSTITVPPEIQRAAAGILITDPPTAAYTHIEDIQSDKYLGVVIDNRLSFNKHTDETPNLTGQRCPVESLKERYLARRTF